MEDARTKIVCTIGPASSAVSMLTRMMRAGMDVARLNFSHGSHREHGLLLKAIRHSAKKVGKTVAILQDLQGPKIRIGDLPAAGVELHEGSVVTFSGAKNAKYNKSTIPLVYERLGKDVKAGDRILLDDGYLEVEVLRVKGQTVSAVVNVGGLLKSHKGANFPDSVLKRSPFTDKDKEDLLFGIKEGVDWICLSFVSSAEVLLEVRSIIAREARRLGIRPPLLMAKVERKAALVNIDSIIEAADGIMLGRGDLGIEIPAEEVPESQKDVVERCRLSGKPIIVATQMLESMRENPRATRAEVSDVANAVFDQADAVMLSAESAAGRYPAVTVQVMADVVREAEASRFDELKEDLNTVNCLPSALGFSVAVMARRGYIKAIIISSSSLHLLGNITMFRPHVPIISVVPDEAAARQVELYAGVAPLVLEEKGEIFVPRLHALVHARLHLPKGQAVVYLTPNRHGGASLSILPL